MSEDSRTFKGKWPLFVNISLLAMTEEEYVQEDHLANLEYLINKEKTHGKSKLSRTGV